MQNFFLYARKSTDVEDKQVMSIDAQLNELREFAARERVNIVAELIERQSAKTPGGPIFNSMLARIESGEADGILAWHPDRLARKSLRACDRPPYVREESLDTEISSLLKPFTLPAGWTEAMLARVKEEKKQDAQSDAFM